MRGFDLLRVDNILGMKFYFFGSMTLDGIYSITIMCQYKASRKTIGEISQNIIADPVALDKTIKKILLDFLHQKENQEKIAKYLLTNPKEYDIIKAQS